MNPLCCTSHTGSKRPAQWWGPTDICVIMSTLCFEINFFFLRIRRKIITWLLRLGCIFFPTWHYINHHCINTTANVLKLNKIYTYKENCHLDLVRLIDINFDKGFLYCSLYFFSKNKIITVSQIMQKDAYAIWHILEGDEYDEIMDRRLINSIEKNQELLDFRF